MSINLKSGKVLSVFSLAMINVIAIDSLRNLPFNAEYGLAIILMYLVGTVCFLIPCCLITAELATAFPETGGSYVWISKAFGQRWGFGSLWLLWIYNVVWYPTILSFIATNIAYLFNPALATSKAFLVPVVLSCFMLATIANALGMRTSSRVSIMGALVGTIIPMAVIIVLGVVWFAKGNASAINLSGSANWFPKMGSLNDLGFFVVIMFSLFGIEMSAIHAGDVKKPRRDFPRALLLSAVIIVLSEIFASLAVSIVVPKAQLGVLSGLDQAFSLFLNAYHLKWLLPVAIILIILGSFAGMTAWVLGPARGMMVAANDGAAPKWLAKENKAGAPITMLWVQAAIVCVLAALFFYVKSVSTYYWILSDLTAQLALVYYIILFAAAIRLRKFTAKNTSCFKMPGKKLGVWFICGLGLLTCVVTMALGFMPPASLDILNKAQFEWIMVIGIIVFACPPLFLFRKNKS